MSYSQSAAKRAETQAQTSDMILRLLRVARGAGVRISVAESIDAFESANAVGFSDRQVLKDALTLTIAKTVEDKQLFEQCFETYFKRENTALGGKIAEAGRKPGAPPQGEGQPGDSQGEGASSSLGQMLLDNDLAGLAAAMERAAEAAGASNITLFTQTNLYARRILDRMGLPELEREVTRLRAEGNTELADRLARARAALGEQARAYMERQLTLFATGTTREIREGALRQVNLSQLDRRDIQRMRQLIREMAKKLAERYSRKRYRDRKGVLDTRRTIRRNMAFDAIPFRTVWKRERIDKPRVMALCDVSGSVASVARFLLMFLYSLNDVLADLRGFAFSSHLVEVSDILSRENSDDAVTKILEAVGFGSTNYGKSLEDFSALALNKINRQTTVIILGDARGNRNEPRVDLMGGIFSRAGRVIWLNPEPQPLWGTGDSDMYRYAPFCHQMVTCNTIAQLERIVEELLATARR
ncbi:MAG: VWA domain-containing protein [Acetobacteraceae bacterium]|nr:VWA domain-containing protein [Acetobacteraceae bacterium]